jgi:histidinol-phosphatase (PHP family)
MYFDAHVHSEVSPDSKMEALTAIETLRGMGLGVVFTEHCDFVTQTEGKDPTANDAPRIAGDFLVDFDRYEKEYRPLRGGRVLLGLEFTLSAAFLPLNTATAAKDWDFVLGAVHTVDGLDLYYDAVHEEPEALTRRYLTYSREMVELCGFFDSLAHIDYICRYAPGVAQRLRAERYPREFDALLKAVAQQGKALEINTARFNTEENIRAVYPIYQRFAELGGRYVTIGSDAHNAPALGRHYKTAMQIAKDTGLTPVYYKERKLYKSEGAV